MLTKSEFVANYDKGRIDSENLETLKKNGAYASQNKANLEVEKKIEEMSKKGGTLSRIGIDGTALGSIDTRKIIPKNTFFQLTNEFYDLAIKINTNGNYVILPSVKQELLRTTKLDPIDLDNIKDTFIEYSTKHRGMDFENFKEMLNEVYGIFDYPFAAPLFNFFDKKNDGLVDFMEFAESINVLYKGDPIVKSRYIFEVIDFHRMKSVGIREINKVFELAYVDIFIDIKHVYNYFVLLKANQGKINMRDLFNNSEILNRMHRSIDIVLDRNEHLKLYVTLLQVVHGFDIYKLQRLWELYRMYFIKSYDTIKLSLSKKDSEILEVETLLLQNLFRSEEYLQQAESNPFEMTCQHFKIIMREIFKINDVQLLDDLFGNICGGEKYSKILLEKFFERITYYFNCKFELKVSLVFEVYCVVRNTTDTPHDCVIDYLAGLFEVYWDYYKHAQAMIDSMLDDQEVKFLTYQLLESKLVEDPSKLDFLFRFTLGRHSPAGSKEKGISEMYLEFADQQDKDNKTKTLGDKTNLAVGYKNWGTK